jgi:uncharacterized protein YajQ (UPF0234 family)
MAKDFTFDIYAEVDYQEVNNAIDQASREIKNRFDFKGSKSEIEFHQKDDEIVLLADDDYKLKAVQDVLESKLVKRNIPLKALQYQKEEDAAGGMKRQKIKLQSGISTEKCKELVKFIKGLKTKVQASIQEDRVRVSGKSKDDLQTVMNAIREKDFDIFVLFGNYR